MDELEIQNDFEEIKEWNDTFGKNLDSIYQSIDSLLECRMNNNSEQECIRAKEKLLNTFSDEEFIKNYYKDGVIAQFSVIISIFQAEEEEGIRSTILDKGNSMNEIIEFYLNMKFKIWRLEFASESDSKVQDLFLELLNSTQGSLHLIKYIIYTSVFDKLNTSFKIAKILKNDGQLAKAYSMYKYALELSPNEEVILCEMATICESVGKHEEAQRLISLIDKPTEILTKYMKEWNAQ